MLTNIRFVEYETAGDLKNAVEKIDGREFKGETVRCVEDVCREALEVKICCFY